MDAFFPEFHDMVVNAIRTRIPDMTDLEHEHGSLCGGCRHEILNGIKDRLRRTTPPVYIMNVAVIEARPFCLKVRLRYREE